METKVAMASTVKWCQPTDQRLEWVKAVAAYKLMELKAWSRSHQPRDYLKRAQADSSYCAAAGCTNKVIPTMMVTAAIWPKRAILKTKRSKINDSRLEVTIERNQYKIRLTFILSSYIAITNPSNHLSVVTQPKVLNLISLRLFVIPHQSHFMLKHNDTFPLASLGQSELK